MSTTTITTAEMAARYRERGWEPLFYERGTKGPTEKGWPDRRYTAEEIAAARDVNLGLLTGSPSNGLADVDLDCREALMLAGEFVPNTNTIFGRQSKPASHRLFETNPIPPYTEFKDTTGEMLLELRTDRHQTMAPPSDHPDKERVEWEQFGQPAHLAGADLLRRCSELAAACILARHWPAKGSRHDAALALAGLLLRAGWETDRAAWFIGQVARAASDAEIEDRAAAAETTAKRIANGAEATGGPRLAQLVGTEVVKRVRTWLELKSDDADDTPGTLRPYHLYSLADFMKLEVPKRNPILVDARNGDAVIRDADIVMVHAWRGRGKSILLADAALAIASGGQCLRWKASRPRNVLLIDGELPVDMIQARIAKLALARGLGPERVPVARLEILSAMIEEWGVTSLATPEGQARLEPYLDPFDVLMFDHLSALFPGAGPENDAASWDATQEWLLKLRRWGKTSWFAHHDSKDGVQRGTSHREDVLDLVLGLKEPKDDEHEGTHFELHFEKHRSVYGAAVTPFEARLEDGPDGQCTWTITELEDPALAEIIEMHLAGKSNRDIAKKLKLHPSTVDRKLAKAQAKGLV